MSFVHNNQTYPKIYNPATMDHAPSSKQLFNNKVNSFISEQTKKLPFKQEQRQGTVVYVYDRRPYYYHSSSFHIDNSTNFITEGGVQAQNKRNNQVLGVIVAAIVTSVATFLAAKYYNEYQAIKEDIDDVKDFKSFIKKAPENDHVDSLRTVSKLRLSELNSAKTYILAKSAVVISSLVSGIFLGIAALATPELMAAGAILTGLSLLAGIFVWSFEHFDRHPKKIAECVRTQLNYLQDQRRPIPVAAQGFQNVGPAINFDRQPAPYAFKGSYQPGYEAETGYEVPAPM